jgi:myotubularin-related protein 9
VWKRISKHHERYDALHTSLVKLIDACCNDYSSTSTIDRWLGKLDASIWLNNVQNTLTTASQIVDELLNKNACVLLHGWEGIDNTIMISSLAQIIVDTQFRTVRGFEMLIEKEWLHGGHPFSRRCVKSAYGSSTIRSEGPVFLLFLDCVRQVYTN